MQVRQLSIHQSVLSRSDGSCRFSFDPDKGVTVLASVTGPQEVKARDELLNQATLQVNVLPLRGPPRPRSKSSASSLHSVLSSMLLLGQFPRSLLQVTIQTVALPSLKFNKPFTSFDASLSEEQAPSDSLDVLETQSCVELAALFNAAVLACMDASFPMSEVAFAVGLAYNNDGTCILDPAIEQEQNAVQCFVMAFTSTDLVWCETTKGGIVPEDQIDHVTQIARKGVEYITGVVRKTMEGRYAPFLS